MTHGEHRCVEIPETIRAKRLSVKGFYCRINTLLAGQSLRVRTVHQRLDPQWQLGPLGLAQETKKMQESDRIWFLCI
jgi:hypothetical protein